MFRKILAVAKWEYLEKVKTKTFIISLLITPLIIISFSIIPTLLFNEETPTVRTVGILDTSGIYFKPLREELDKYELEDGQPNFLLINLAEKNGDMNKLKNAADKEVLSSKLDSYLLFINAGTDSLNVEYRSASIGNFKEVQQIENTINSIRINLKLKEEGIRTELAEFLKERVKIGQIKVEYEGKEKKHNFSTVFFTSFIFMLLLMMMVIYSGQMLVRSMIEEKSNRLIEVLVSSSTSDELLAGKIIGLSSLGLTQIFIWMLIGISLVGGSVIPPEAFENIVPMLGYFILGFLFYTTLFVGIGSIVTTEQEAQQITTYLSLILMLPVVIALPSIQNPDFMLLKILTYIPLTIPTVMLLRLNAAPVPPSEILISILIMLLSIIIMIKISAKIFRIGILSYGSKPSLKEIISWIKEG